ncbi:MAG: DsbE family thiol:disulfide interchange protein, partial [Halieaceae bacterium]|nr:DsbE family thiol:disulfide interchange protein [Halieaceae bacterium]
DSEKARQWLAELGDPYRLNIADGDGTVGLDLGVYGAPETYVLGPDGVILHRHVGVLDEAVFERDISQWFTTSARVAQAGSVEGGE